MNSETTYDYEPFDFNFDIPFQKNTKILSLTISINYEKLMLLNYFIEFTVKQKSKEKKLMNFHSPLVYFISDINCSVLFILHIKALHLKSGYKLVFK